MAGWKSFAGVGLALVMAVGCGATDGDGKATSSSSGASGVSGASAVSGGSTSVSGAGGGPAGTSGATSGANGGATEAGGISGGGASGSGGTSAAPPLPADQFKSTFAKAQCDGLGACCAANQHSFIDFSCQSQAEDKWRQEFENGQKGGGAYDPVAGGECFAAVKAQLSCGYIYEYRDIPACHRMFVGAYEDGRPCSSDQQCKSGFCAHDAQDPLVSACGPFAFVPWFKAGKTGDKCVTTCTDPQCRDANALAPVVRANNPTVCRTADSVFCDSTDNTCQPLRSEGQACQADPDCQAPLYCVRSTDKCGPRQAAGTTCNYDDMCEGELCEDLKCAVSKASADWCSRANL